MKTFLFVLLAIPVLVMAQTKNVINATRVFPKADKVADFEKALAAHAQKYHTGDWKWRVYEIQTGPDAGGYHIVEGPNAWATIDGRANLVDEHTKDWNQHVAVYLTDKVQESYSLFADSLSTVAVGDFSDKIIINHIYPKPGMIKAATDMVKKFKKVWMEGNENMAVFQAVISGQPQIAIVSRLKDGLKELADGYRKPLSERYEAVYGAGSWDAYLADYAKCIENRWSELLVYRAELGSKQ